MRRRAAPALLLLALVLGGCVYYPMIPDIGGIRIRPQNARAVSQPLGLAVYMDVDSSGKYGDTIVGATSEIAGSAVLVTPRGEPAGRLKIPGETVVRLSPEGPHIVLSDLTKSVTPGEVVLVTLLFEKIGRIGVPTRVE